MVGEALDFNSRRSSMRGGTFASAILLMATMAQAQSMDAHGQALSTAGSATLLHRVAETGGGPGEDRGPVSQGPNSQGPGNFADLAEKVAPAVIAVSAKATATLKAFPRRQGGPRNESPVPDMPDTPEQGQRPDAIEMVSMGSGFFISPDGYAVTNRHVVEDSDTAEIRTSDNKAYSAKVIGKDSLSDLALIKVEGRATSLT